MDYNQKEVDDLLHHLLDLGEMMLESGGEVNRVEDTLSRMGAAYGALRTNVFVITTNIWITMTFPGEIGSTQTRRVLNRRGTDFKKLEALNCLSRRCWQNPLPVCELQREIEKMKKPASRKELCVGSILVAGSFAVFFGGTVRDGLAAAAFAVLICLLQIKFEQFCPNKVSFNALCSFAAGLGICFVCKVLPGLNMDKIMIGDIMLLIPGLALTNSVRDVFAGDTMSGLMRLTESLLWAGALACGFMVSIWMVG